jgi:hypothetical protein
MVKVVGYTPEDPTSFCSPLADCGGMWAEVAAPGDWVYHVELMLEDSTGSLHALLWKDEAERFFHGIPPGAHSMVRVYNFRVKLLWTGIPPGAHLRVMI